MYFPIPINWTSPFPIVRWHFSSLFKFQMNFYKQTEEKPDQTPPLAAPDLVLHCLPMSHKKNARLIWVNGHSMDNKGSEVSAGVKLRL